MRYSVTWSVDVDAVSPRQAAEKAAESMAAVTFLDPDAGTVFEVRPAGSDGPAVKVDLDQRHLFSPEAGA